MNNLLLFFGFCYSVLFPSIHSIRDIPKSHVPILEMLINKYMNTTPARHTSIADILFGDGSATENLDLLDVNHLNRAMLKSLIEAESNKTKTKALEEAKARRQLHSVIPHVALQNERDKARRQLHSVIPHVALQNERDKGLYLKLFDLMKQSIYGVRYRLAETKLLRIQFRESENYNIGIIVSNVYQLILRTEIYLDHVFRLPIDTFLLWHLIIYEKILANSIDVENLVMRAFLYQKMLKDKLNKFDEPSGPAPGPVGGNGTDEGGGPHMVPSGSPTQNPTSIRTPPHGHNLI